MKPNAATQNPVEMDAALRARLEEAAALQSAGKYGEAAPKCESILRHYPAQPDALNLLGLIEQGRNRPEQAMAYFRQAYTAEPRYARAHYNLANLLRSMGRNEEAIAHYRHALAHNAQHADTHNNLGLALMDAERPAEALPHCLQALLLQPGQERHWSNFSMAMGRARLPRPAINEMEPALRPLLIEALNNPLSIQQHTMVAVLASMVIESTQEFIRLETSTPEVLKQEWRATTPALLSDSLLQALLSSSAIPNIAVEKTLTAVRAALLTLTLEDALHAPQMEAMLPFLRSLAQQCFLNEYVYAETAAETTALAELAGRVEAAALTDLTSRWQLLLFACYRRLMELASADRLASAGGQNDPILQNLIARQIEEPRQEASLKKEIPAFGNIGDSVSRQVQDQYESNPYPRWLTLPSFPPSTIRQSLAAALPHFPLEKMPDPNGTPRVLVAGCGTGRHALIAALSYADSQILAVDLSRTSLAYAMRKAHEHGISNITFMQADILTLRGLEERFDVIESIGVLHHLQNPLAGWQVLSGLLAPRGAMKVGLYSAAGRQSITAARALLAEKQYPLTEEGIRAGRQEIIQIADSLGLGEILNTSDFYSLSGCRDLLFHVQEHCLTLKEIRRMLDQLGLAFAGMEYASAYIPHLYQRNFPQDKSMMSLENWTQMERRFPRLFAGMYRFWVTRRAD